MTLLHHYTLRIPIYHIYRILPNTATSLHSPHTHLPHIASYQTLLHHYTLRIPIYHIYRILPNTATSLHSPHTHLPHISHLTKHCYIITLSAYPFTTYIASYQTLLHHYTLRIPIYHIYRILPNTATSLHSSHTHLPHISHLTKHCYIITLSAYPFTTYIASYQTLLHHYTLRIPIYHIYRILPNTATSLHSSHTHLPHIASYQTLLHHYTLRIPIYHIYRILPNPPLYSYIQCIRIVEDLY